MEKYNILSEMKRFGLNSNAKRKTTFLTTTAICQSYTKTLQKRFATLYRAMGVIGNGKIMHYVLNIDYSAQIMKRSIEQDKHNLRDKIIKEANENFLECQNRFEAAKELDPWQKLSTLGEILYDYSYILGLYGGFNRLIDLELLAIDEIIHFFGDIGKARNRVAHLYLEIDHEILRVYEEISKSLGINKDLLYFLSYEEAKQFVSDKMLSDVTLKALSERQNGLLFIYTVDDDKEQISTDKELILEAEDLFEWKKSDEDQEKVNGIAAFHGQVKGRAFLLHFNNMHDIPEDSIIITNMTVMSDARMVKKAIGVVTDEGGMLSHAAVLCRELKIPCLIGTKIATKIFKDGDLIEIDTKNNCATKI